MAEIFGTRRADVLVGTDGNDIVRGGRGEDSINGALGDDILYGGWGNDSITDRDGRSEIYGGRGGDEITFARGHAYGGLGADSIGVEGGGWAIGGVGNDFVWGSGYLFGDQTPDMVQQAGNDRLNLFVDADGVRANGGLGADIFRVILQEEIPGVATVEDFTPGQDKIGLVLATSGEEDADLFPSLDSNHNGIIEGTDNGVFADAASNTLFLTTDGSLVVVHGTTQISAHDWLV